MKVGRKLEYLEKNATNKLQKCRILQTKNSALTVIQTCTPADHCWESRHANPLTRHRPWRRSPGFMGAHYINPIAFVSFDKRGFDREEKEEKKRGEGGG